jgi:chromosomal replication initiation ATPase DnaA
MAESRQFPLELALEPRFGAEDFLVSESNGEAYGVIESWPDWPDKAMVLSGPAASGKSHLAAIWALRAKARVLSARALNKADIPALVSAKAVVVEDVDRGEVPETGLFHLINLAQERQSFLLLTGIGEPALWPFSTADLVSRFRRLTVARIAAPDDALIRALFVKLFVDRQLVVDTALVEYLSLRTERSFAAVRATVNLLDRETMASGKRLTRAMASRILGYT